MSRRWNAALALVITAAVIAQIVVLLTGGADANTNADEQAVSAAMRLVRFFSFFTVESNLLVLAAALTLVANPARDGRWWRVVRLDALLGIVITFIVFATILAGQVHHTGIGIWINAGLHYVSPIMAVIGWAIWGPRPRIDRATIAWAFVWPVAWVGYTFIHGAASGWWPYPFLNADRHGWPVAIRNTAGVFILAFLILAILYYLERWLVSRSAASPGTG